MEAATEALRVLVTTFPRRDLALAAGRRLVAEELGACAARLRELYPYEVPPIAGWPLARVHPDYARWARGGEEPA